MACTLFKFWFFQGKFLLFGPKMHSSAILQPINLVNLTRKQLMLIKFEGGYASP